MSKIIKRWLERKAAFATHLLAKRPQLFSVHPIPYPFHIIPVCHNPMLHRVFNLEETPKFLSSPAYEHVSFQGAGHDAYMFGSPDAEGSDICSQRNARLQDNRLNYRDAQWRKEAFGVILPCEAGLYRSRALWKELVFNDISRDPIKNTNIVNDNWLISEHIVVFDRHIEHLLLNGACYACCVGLAYGEIQVVRGLVE